MFITKQKHHRNLPLTRVYNTYDAGDDDYGSGIDDDNIVRKKSVIFRARVLVHESLSYIQPEMKYETTDLKALGRFYDKRVLV